MEHKPENNQCGNRIVRRTFFQWLTYGLSALAAAALGIPLIGYFLGVRKRDVHWSRWTRWTATRSTKRGWRRLTTHSASRGTG